MIAWLVSMGADVNTGLAEEFPVVAQLAQKGFTKCLQFLLAKGAALDVPTFDGDLPLHLAAQGGHEECVALLVDAMPASVLAVNALDGQTALCKAARAHSLSCCRLLLDAGSVVDHVDSAGFTPLSYALLNVIGDRCVAEVLLDHGASLDLVSGGEIPQWARSFVASRNCCRNACMVMLLLRRLKSQAVGQNGRDVLRMIAQMVWEGLSV